MNKPLTLLNNIKKTLHPKTNHLIITIILPFKPLIKSNILKSIIFILFFFFILQKLIQNKNYTFN